MAPKGSASVVHARLPMGVLTPDRRHTHTVRRFKLDPRTRKVAHTHAPLFLAYHDTGSYSYDTTWQDPSRSSRSLLQNFVSDVRHDTGAAYSDRFEL